MGEMNEQLEMVQREKTKKEKVHLISFQIMKKDEQSRT